MSTTSWKTIEQTKNFLRLSFVLRLFIHKFIVFHMNLILRVCVFDCLRYRANFFLPFATPLDTFNSHLRSIFLCPFFIIFPPPWRQFFLCFFLFKSRYRFWLERDSQRNWFLSLNYVNWFPLAYNFLITSASPN